MCPMVINLLFSFLVPRMFIFFLRVASKNEFLICIANKEHQTLKESPSLTQRPWPSGRKTTFLSRSAAGSITLGWVCQETEILLSLTYPHY